MRFKAQHPIDVYIADFYCHKLKLVIEIDGGIHQNRDQSEYDSGRTDEMGELGIKVIRFTNDQVNKQLSQTVRMIKNEIEKRITELLQKTDSIPPFRGARLGLGQ